MPLLLLFFLFTLFSPPLLSHELTLSRQEAEKIALENNKDLQSLQQLLCRANEGRLETISSWFPQIEMMSFGYQTQKADLYTHTRSVFLTQFSLTQALLSADQFYNVKIASLVVCHLQSLVEALTIDLLYEVRTTYYRLVFDQETIAAAKRNVELFAELAAQQKANYKRGTAILLNVNQSQVAMALATRDYYEAVKQYKLDRDAMTALLGFDPGSVEMQVKEEGIPLQTIPKLRQKLLEVQNLFARKEGDEKAGDEELFHSNFPQAQQVMMQSLFTSEELLYWEQVSLAYHPLLHAKAEEVKIAKQQMLKRIGSYLPTVDLSINYGAIPSGTTEFTSSSFTRQQFQWGVGLQFNWLIWDSFGRQHSIRGARYEKFSKEFNYLKEIQTILKGVRRQIFTIEEAIASFVTEQSSVLLSEQTLSLARQQLAIGYINVFDYQIVINDLIKTVNSRNRASFELIKGYYGLIHASGADFVQKEM